MNIAALATELTTDPLTRGYSGMSDQAAADDVNTLYRPAEGTLQELLWHLVQDGNRTNQNNDTLKTNMLGRLKHVADSAVGSNPFDAGTTPVNYAVTLQMKHAATAMLLLVTSPGIASVRFDDADLDLMYNALKDAGIWKQADINTAKALSQNQQSRASELGLGGKVKVGHVANARA
jgi:hypothetical protein